MAAVFVEQPERSICKVTGMIEVAVVLFLIIAMHY